MNLETKEFGSFDDSMQMQEWLASLTGHLQVLDRSGNRLQAFLELLEDEVESLPAAAEHLRHSMKQTEHIRHWCAQIGHGVPQNIIRDRLALEPLLEGVLDRCHKVGMKDVHLVSGDILNLQGDPFLLQQLLFEVLQKQERNRSWQLHGSSCVVTETDVGMARSSCPAGRYVRLDMLPTESEEASHGFPDLPLREFLSIGEHLLMGTGGMTAMGADVPFFWYGCMLQHGGDLLVHRQGAAKGFAFLFPQLQETGYGDTLRGHHETILLVDDEDMIWDVISDMLEELGYEVLLAGNGQEAVEIYCANPGKIDLVLMDMIMPGMNAAQAFPLLKQFDPNVKVLLSSGYVSEEDAQELLHSGAKGFLRKPYSLADLAQRIRQILD